MSEAECRPSKMYAVAALEEMDVSKRSRPDRVAVMVLLLGNWNFSP